MNAGTSFKPAEAAKAPKSAKAAWVWRPRPWHKPLVWLALAAPAVWLLWAAIYNQLGANPADALIRSLGDWTLRLLCLTLAVSPLRQAFGWNSLARWRRNLGVATFIYGSLHWLAYAWLDQGLDWPALWADVAKRPFILVGTAAWLAMLPLAATSFNAAVRWLGGAAWQKLHQITYALGPLALLHFFWMRAAKQRFGEVWVYAAIVLLLLGWRLWRRFATKR